jgi:hypothetical protein
MQFVAAFCHELLDRLRAVAISPTNRRRLNEIYANIGCADVVASTVRDHNDTGVKPQERHSRRPARA